VKKLKIYLDTSVISHLHADDVPEKMAKTLEFWDCIELEEYVVYISDLVAAEIEECLEPKKSFLKQKMDKVPLEVIEISDETVALAEKYVSEGVFSSKYMDDATHVAAASVIGCTAIVSWNFKHIVKLKTIIGVNGINRFMGYGEIEIITPEIIIEEEGD
jgi:predicted nucleic acid-binding protein